MKRGPKPQVTPEAWIEAIVTEMKTTDDVEIRIDAVARRLGVTKGSFYNYFESREDAVQRALDVWLESENKVLAEMESTPVTSYEQIIERLFSTVGQFEYPIVFFLVGVSKRRSQYRELARRIQRERYTRVEQMLSTMGIVPPTSDRIAVAVIPSLFGLSYLEYARLLETPSVPTTKTQRWTAVAAMTTSVVKKILDGENPRQGS